MTIFEIAMLAVNFTAASLLFWQLVGIGRTAKLDYERRKNQATVEIAAKEFREARALLQQHCITTELTQEGLENLMNDKEKMSGVNAAFGILEHVSVALHANIYNKNLFFEMSGKSCIEIFDNYQLYIEFRRKNHGRFTYSQFEKLVTENKIEGAVKH